MGLLRVFSAEAVKTAGKYAIAHCRKSVSTEDMKKALKYQARMFFQQVEDLDGRVEEAARDYVADVDEDGGENSDGTDSDGDGENDEEGEEEEPSDEAGADAEQEPAAEDDETSSVSTSNSTSTRSTISASSLTSSAITAALAPSVTAGEAVEDEVEVDRCHALARRVDAIVESWSRYEPDDPVLRMIKNAIDATDRQQQDEEPPAAPPSKRQRHS